MKRKAELKRVIRENFWGIRPFKRHSLVVMVAGAFYTSMGLVYIWSEPTQGRKEALAVALNFAPIEFWGTVFMLCGLMSIISSRWPPITETWGYILLSALSTGWSATYLLGVILEDSPPSNLSGTLSWGLTAFIWWAVSGLVNPDKTIVVVINDEGTTS